MIRQSRARLLPLVALITAGACQREGTPMGPADSYLVYEPAGDAPKNQQSGQGGGVSLPLFREVPLDDTRAAPIHRASAEGFLGELLRTDYLAKQLIRDGWQGQAFSAAARARAQEPTVLVLMGTRMARSDEANLGVGFSKRGLFGRAEKHGNVMWIEAGDDPVSDPAFVQTVAGRLGRLIASRLTAAAAAASDGGGTAAPATAVSTSHVLVDGYALAMEVIGREWRVGEGPQGTLPASAGTGTQRERFAGVRANAFVVTAEDPGRLRSPAEMIIEPGVIATVIHRMAQATGIGRRVAPAEIYAPFVGQRVPPGVSPAAVLGPIRNFQVKLLCAWAGAILAGSPPRDLIDLITAYAAALPAERSEVMRIFVASTYGATVKPGGVSPKAANADAAIAELTALAAQVTAGQRTLRAALAP